MTEIIAVEDFIGGPESTGFTTTDLFIRRAIDGPLERTGLGSLRMNRLQA